MYAPVVSRFTTYGVKVPPPVSAYMARMMTLPGMVAWGRRAQKEVDNGLPRNFRISYCASVPLSR